MVMIHVMPQNKTSNAKRAKRNLNPSDGDMM
jgi:ribosomal protein L32